LKTKKITEIGFNLKPFNDMVVFDLETTGLSSRMDDIIQIAAIRMIDGNIIEDDSFSSYVKPQRSLSSFITSYTGITERDVKAAPLPAVVLPQFSSYCGDSLLVAHNGQRFDIPFIHRTCERYSISTRAAESIDSMHLSWKVWGRSKGLSHGLDGVISRLEISTAGIRRHDARGDVLATARCVQRLVKKIGELENEVFLNINPCALPETINN
jgi:DNA polymerase III alpha subunit (gram-positive type)